MPYVSQLFADRIVNVAVTGTLVRRELGALAPLPSDCNKPVLRTTQALVMPLDCFLASMGMFESVVKKMVADGVLKPCSPTDPVPATEATTPSH